MRRLVNFAYPMPGELTRKNVGMLRGPKHCFHDSFRLTCRYDNADLVLGFLCADSEIYPHAWIQINGTDIDPTNDGPGPRIALYQWSHKVCKDYVADSPAAELQGGERAVVPPRVNRAGDVVFTEIDGHDKECLGKVDTERAAQLRLELLAMLEPGDR